MRTLNTLKKSGRGDGAPIASPAASTPSDSTRPTYLQDAQEGSRPQRCVRKLPCQSRPGYTARPRPMHHADDATHLSPPLPALHPARTLPRPTHSQTASLVCGFAECTPREWMRSDGYPSRPRFDRTGSVAPRVAERGFFFLLGRTPSNQAQKKMKTCLVLLVMACVTPTHDTTKSCIYLCFFFLDLLFYLNLLFTLHSMNDK